jgi:PKD domain
MKHTHSLLIVLLMIQFACSTEGVELVADFTFRNETTSTFVMATYDTCSLINKSQNVQSVKWDLGDGRSSNERNVILSFDKSGTYDVTLTITSKGGQETMISKTVLVKDRVLRSIDISKIYWEENINGWPATAEADIYLQIQKYTDTTMTAGYLCLNCPVIYTSPLIQGVNRSADTLITIPVTEKIVIDKKLIGNNTGWSKFAIPPYLDNAYLISLMAKDINGNVYCLQSNRGGGTYYGILHENFAMNKFILQVGPFSDYKLVCDFE